MKTIVICVAAMLFSRYTTDAQTISWEQISGLGATYIADLITSARGHVFAASDSGVFRSTDDGKTWTWNRLLYSRSMEIDLDGRVFVTGQDSSRIFVYRSTDNGDTWTRLGNGWSACWGSLCFVPGVRLAANSQQHLFAALYHYAFNEYWDDGIWRSTDHGLTWDSLTNFGYLTRYTLLEINRHDDIFAGIVSNYNDPIPRVFRTTDNGSTWSRADSGLSESVSSLGFNSLNDAYAGSWNALTGNSVYSSTDNGYTWSFQDTVGAAVSVMLFDGSDSLYVATSDRGVYRNGIQVNTGLTDLRIASLALSPTGYIYAGTVTSGVFRSVLPTVDVGTVSTQGPESFFLSQNYPNPFNPKTVIQYDLPRDSHVTLRIFDVLGKEVINLVDQDRQAGYHQVTLDATNLASGMYLYRLTAGSFTDMKKLLVVK